MPSEPTRDPGEGRLPDLIVIGAMKSGTSSLHEYLAAHPDISMSEAKELGFFLRHRFEQHGLEWYRQQFGARPGAKLAGESSPQYTMCHEFPGVAERMHSVIPEARLIYIVRDPVRRMESQWVHLIGSGELRASFDDALRDLDHSLLVQTSRYWMQLSEYLRFFPADQILVRSAEQLAADPRAVVRDVLAHVGLDPDFDSPVFDQRFHESVHKVRPNALGRLLWGNHERRRRLAATVPWLVGRPIPAPVWEPRTLERVKGYLAPDVDALRAHTGLAFTEWAV